MTKKGRILFYSLLIAAFLLKEEIYGLLLRNTAFAKQENSICNIQNKNIEEKYQELTNAYQFTDTVPYHLEYSKVLYQDIYSLKNGITIYKGKENKIQEKNLVINEQGLVGIISKVNKNSSEVDLLLNENLNLSVKINDSYGILKYKNKELIVEGMNNKSELKENDFVYTSDLSIYPENVLIGVVAEIEYDHYEIEKRIKVTPAVDFEKIKYVSIITDLRGVE